MFLTADLEGGYRAATCVRARILLPRLHEIELEDEGLSVLPYTVIAEITVAQPCP
jgi:hypothetical protein